MGDIDSLRKISVEKLIEKENEIRMENWLKREFPGYPPTIDEIRYLSIFYWQLITERQKM